MTYNISYASEHSCDQTVSISKPKITTDGFVFTRKDADRILFVLNNCLPKYKKLIEIQDKEIKLLKLDLDLANKEIKESENFTTDVLKLSEFWKLQYYNKIATESSFFKQNEFWLLLGLVIGSGTVALSHIGE